MRCFQAIFDCVVARVDIASIRLIFWDLGGQEDLQSLWDKVSGHGTLCVCMCVCVCESKHEGVLM